MWCTTWPGPPVRRRSDSQAVWPRRRPRTEPRPEVSRALALEPQILFLDEPTAALDVGASESFYEWLNKMRSSLNITLVIVSHDVGVISRYVSTIACLNQTMVAHGVPEKVLNKENLEKMYGCEAVFFHHGKVPHMVVSEPHSHSHLKGEEG